MKKEVILLVLILTFSSGCISNFRQVPNTTVNNRAELTLIPSPSATVLPTSTITASSLLRKTPSITPIPTWTLLPTMEPTIAILFVEGLLKNNTGCRLPCWWGIVPGKSSWTETKQFMSSFSNFVGIIGKPNEFQIAEFDIPTSENTGPIEQRFGIKNNTVIEITNIYFGNITSSYNLVEMLTTYGQPDAILLSAYYEPRYSAYMNVVAVFYLKQGILAEYYDNGGVLKGETLEVCPQQADYPHLDLWAPENNLNIQEATEKYLDTINWPTYKSLVAATGMNIETFYNTFKDPNNNTCLQLLTTDWPKN